MSEIVIDRVNLNSSEKETIIEFLKTFELELDENIECTLCAKIGNEIVGTCSYGGKVIKCFAVREDMQGEGIASKLMTEISNIMFDKGIFQTFIFTKPKNKELFLGLGYKVVYEVKDVVLIEGFMSNAFKHIQHMYVDARLEGDKRLSSNPKAALVMNCNPFTLGHRYLIEKAAKENNEVLVFVVQEDKSVFPFEARLDLVKKCVSDLKNVCVMPGGDYTISSATFPTYFLKKEDQRLDAYTALDAGIFGKYFSTVFNIKTRYVGTEPYCRVTNKYNTALMEILPKYEVEVKLVDRLEIDGVKVTASEVRKLIKEGKMQEVRKLVPDATWEYLNSDEAKSVIEKIRGNI